MSSSVTVSGYMNINVALAVYGHSINSSYAGEA